MPANDKRNDHLRKTPLDAAILGTSGAVGYGSHRVGESISKLNKLLNDAFAKNGITEGIPVNGALLEDLDALKRNINPNNVAANAYTYSEIMHRAANKPLFYGGEAVGSEKGLDQFHKLLQDLGNTVATDDIDKHVARLKRLGRRLGLIRRDGTIAGLGIHESSIPDRMADVRSWLNGMAAIEASDPKGWGRTLRHFQAFKNSPLDGYRQLVHEARGANLGTGIANSLTYNHIANLIERSKDFKTLGYPSREAALRDFIFSKVRGDIAGTADKYEGAFNALLNDVATRGGADRSGFLWNVVGDKDFAPSDQKFRTFVPERLYAAAERADKALVAKGKPPRFKALLSRIDRGKHYETMLKRTPFDHVQMAVGKPLSGRGHGMQHLMDVWNHRTVANNIVDPLAGGIATVNAGNYSSIRNAFLGSNVIRSKAMKNLGRVLRAGGYAVPALGLGAVAMRHLGGNKMQKKSSYPDASDTARFVTNANGIADPGLNRVITTRPGILYYLKRGINGPGTAAGSLALLLAGLAEARREPKSRSRDEKIRRLRAMLLSSVGGAGLGHSAVAWDASPLARAIARRQAENLLPVYAGMAAGGRMGTGELMMTSNMAEELRRAGFNTKIFDPEQVNILNAELKDGDALSNFFKGRPDLRDRELALYGVSNNPAVPNASLEQLKGKSVKELEAILSDGSNPLSDVLSRVVVGKPGSLSKADRRNLTQFEHMLNSGEFDGIPPGILRDHLMLKRDAILSGKLKVGDPRKLREELSAAKQFFTGEGDMWYSGLPIRDRMFGEPETALNGWFSVRDPYPFSAVGPDGKPLIRYNIEGGNGNIRNPELGAFRDRLREGSGLAFVDTKGGPGPRSLGEAIGFKANYSPSKASYNVSEELIPFSKVDNSLVNRTGIGSRLRFRIDNEALRRFAAERTGISPEALRGKKLIFITSGGGGQHIADKLRLLAAVTKDRNDVHFVVQTGSGKATVGINELAAELNKGRDIPLVTTFDRAPQKLFQRFSRGADLNVSYGGSSTLTEALSNRNPTLFLHESSMNRPNLEWATSRFGEGSGYGLADALDTDAYFVRRWGEQERKRLGQSFDEFWHGTVWRPESEGGLFDKVIPGGRNPIGEIVDKARRMGTPEEFESAAAKKVNYLLDNADSVMRQRATGVRKLLDLVKKRNSQVIDTAKYLQGGLHIPGKYRALGAAAGALGFGGLTYGIAASRGKRRKPVAVHPTRPFADIKSMVGKMPDWVAPAAIGTVGTLGTLGLVNYLKRKLSDNDKNSDESRGFNVSTY